MTLRITYQLDSYGTKMVYYIKKNNTFLSVHYTREEAEKEFAKMMQIIKDNIEPEIIKEVEI